METVAAAPKTAKLRAQDDGVFDVPVDTLRRCPLLAQVLDTSSEDDEIPIPCSTRIAAVVIEFLEKNIGDAQILKITLPLKTLDLRDAGFHEWAVDLIYRIEAGMPAGTNPHILCFQLAETALSLGLKMLEQLAVARTACMVKELGSDEIKTLYGAVNLTTEEEKNLKAQNEWAWKEPDAPITDEPIVV